MRMSVKSTSGSSRRKAVNTVSACSKAVVRMHVDAEQVSDQAVVLDRRAHGGFLQKDSGIHRLQVAPRPLDGHTADRHIGRGHRDDVADAAAVEHGAGTSGQHKRPIDVDRAGVDP